MLLFLTIDKALFEDQKENIVIVDDVTTEGMRFKACQSLLQTISNDLFRYFY